MPFAISLLRFVLGTSPVLAGTSLVLFFVAMAAASDQPRFADRSLHNLYTLHSKGGPVPDKVFKLIRQMMSEAVAGKRAGLGRSVDFSRLEFLPDGGVSFPFVKPSDHRTAWGWLVRQLVPRFEQVGWPTNDLDWKGTSQDAPGTSHARPDGVQTAMAPASSDDVQGTPLGTTPSSRPSVETAVELHVWPPNVPLKIARGTCQMPPIPVPFDNAL